MRLIDADSIIAFINAGHLINPSALSWSDNDVVDMIESRPTIDAVPVIRCKDCKHFKRDIPCVGGTYNGCDQLEGMDGCDPYVEEDFFCAYGERRTNE